MNHRKLGLSSGIVLMFGGFYALWVWGLQQIDDAEGGAGAWVAAAPLAALSALLFALGGVIFGDMLREWWEWLHRD